MYPVEGDAPDDLLIRAAQARLREHPETADARAFVELGTLFVRRARRLEDPGLYREAGDAADRALAKSPDDTKALHLRAAVLLDAHRFTDARDAALRVVRNARPTPETYAILSDASLELGDYDAAVDAAQHMVDLEPGGAAYVRVAWLRWLHGDAAGARESYNLAAGALPRAAADRAWIITQAAQLALVSGAAADARALFVRADTESPGFSAANAALARIALADGDTAGALAHARTAVASHATFENQWVLLDALRASRLDGEARTLADTMARTGPRTDPRVYALYLASTGGSATDALALARAEHDARPDVWSDDVMARAQLAAGDLAGAQTSMDRALRLGTPDPRMALHAGLVAAARNDAASACPRLATALASRAALHPSEVNEALVRQAAVCPAAIVAPRAH